LCRRKPMEISYTAVVFCGGLKSPKEILICVKARCRLKRTRQNR
jgi:hypothetical protein